MPSHYAHRVFGQKVLQRLSVSLKEEFSMEKEAFDLGLQGPDLLFYHHPLWDNRIRAEGAAIHDRPGKIFFLPGQKFLKEKKGVIERSYLAGALCHFLLDCACHPFIEKNILQSGVSHGEIEMEFDRFLILGDGLDLFRSVTTAPLSSFHKLAEHIRVFYPSATSAQLEKAMRSIKKYTRLKQMKNPVIRPVLFSLMKAVGIYEEYHSMIYPFSPNPLCEESSRVLAELMENSVIPAANSIACSFGKKAWNSFLEDKLEFNFGGTKL